MEFEVSNSRAFWQISSGGPLPGTIMLRHQPSPTELTIYSYSHTETSLQSIEAGLSTSRLKKYLDYADGDLEKAIELHSWNCALGASLHIPIQHFELILRNACDRELQSIFGQPDWFNVLPTGPIPKPVAVIKKKSLRVVLLERFKSVREWLIGLSKPTKEVPVEITTWDYLNNEIKIVKERLSQSKRDPNNPPGSSQSVSPYIDKTNPIFKQRTPNLFDKASGQNP